MKAYGGHNLKGISGRRKSKDSAHRRRSLRVDKKRERKRAVEDALEVDR
jgi:hypothetical protein